MKKFSRIISGVAVAAMLAAAVLVTPAQAAPLTDTLKERVAQLSADQQEALLGLLEAIGGAKGGEAAASAPTTKEEQLAVAIETLKKAAVDEDIDAVMSLIHEDFEHYQVGDKADLRDFIQNAIDMGYVGMYAEDIEIYTDDTEFEEDGDEVIIYPIDVELPIASVTLEFVVKEVDGKYLITTLDISGI